MRARTLTLLLAALLILPAAPARAATLPHYDLTSLALQAEGVILARRGGERQIAPYLTCG